MPYSLHEIMTGDPKNRFPQPSDPDSEGWWPSAYFDQPDYPGEYAGRDPSDQGSKASVSPKQEAAPSVSVLKRDTITVESDTPLSMPSDLSDAERWASMDGHEHPPMLVTVPNQDEASGSNELDVIPTVTPAFTKEETEAILRGEVRTSEQEPQQPPQQPPPLVSPQSIPSSPPPSSSELAPSPMSPDQQPIDQRADMSAPQRAPAQAMPSQPEPTQSAPITVAPRSVAPSVPIPADDTDSWIVESFTEEDQDETPYGAPFSSEPPAASRFWGRSARRRSTDNEVDRNLTNTHAPLDVLFAQDQVGKARRMALQPGFGRDILVWLVALIGAAQLLGRFWVLLPTLTAWNANHSDFQIRAAISLMVGGAVGVVLTILAVRFITGMRSSLPWMIGSFLVFGVFPWYGFGSQLSPTGLPPIPPFMDVLFNPIYDPSSMYGLALFVLAICALAAGVAASMVGTSRRS
ncbi:hypothetical protein [Stomatohabitans albus]|uniref:hypothetical protein n=1 Tax=Stomatohabitans albus TaxID=3110766 RepID=UPI00300D4B8E